MNAIITIQKGIITEMRGTDESTENLSDIQKLQYLISAGINKRDELIRQKVKSTNKNQLDLEVESKKHDKGGNVE